MNTSIVPGAVVVGVDGSPGSDIAVVWAAKHAKAQHRPLAIVHGTGAPGVTDLGFDHVEARKNLRMAGRRVTDAALGLAQRTATGLPITVCMAVREPRELLVDAATQGSVLVLGARGHGRLASLLLGSVSSALSSMAPGPVVIARALPEDADATGAPVVLGLDGTAASTGAVRLAFESASSENRPLHVVHALGEVPVSPYRDVLAAEQLHRAREDGRRRIAESLAGFAEKFPDVPVQTTLSLEAPAEALRHAAQAAFAVVVGSRGRGPVARRLLGSVGRSLVEQAPCTVAVVPGDAS